ncbi:MAG: GTP cyclohydrolase II [Chloroflexi bacterium AL-W]|nr:GTP cyclohydrolase II [Chloroflexi bacterium AL-N1]NOK68240.1 GTP cyclohydrolase II [Chloroflexi bacterium AL-N10]NOK73886.1 GTP cyclohydrolase II [Chloroflexi bacterium AL-N5]NOK82854.1 GTP cyclohydrolase II [Chloroflexi bacterium AL-W]NOK90376.1 GTP cyclohydrolase II [Chloroflexi bacterium AL-N15]
MSDRSYLPHNANTYFQQSSHPYVTISYAQSLDGCLTLQQGHMSPVSSQASLVITHELRAAHDAILIGINTVLSDDPSLTVRLVKGENPQPVILDSQLRFPPNAKLASHPSGVWLATTQHISNHPHTILTMPADEAGQVDLHALLDELGRRRIQSLMVEGGTRVISSFLRQRLVNRVVVTIAPVFAGGYHAVQNLNIIDWKHLPRLHNTQICKAGDDYMLWGDIQ